MFPKVIPCPGCGAMTKVVLRKADGRSVLYIGAKCHACGAFVQAAAKANTSKEATEEAGMRELRRQWKQAKDEIDQKNGAS